MAVRRQQSVMRGPILLACVALVLGACENPASPGQHLRAYGVVVLDGTEEVVRAQGTAVTGALVVPAGQQEGPFTVRMLDRNGGVIEPRQGYWLRVTSMAPGIARWEQVSETEWGGTLTGVAPGDTELEFCNMHGAVGRGHPDGCQAVTVTVMPAS